MDMDPQAFTNHRLELLEISHMSLSRQLLDLQRRFDEWLMQYGSRPSSPPLPESLGGSGAPDPEIGWTPIYHRIERASKFFPPPCGMVGLYLLTPPTPTLKADRKLMRVRTPTGLGWHEPDRNDEPRCSSCFAQIDPFSNSDLDYLGAMQPSPDSPLNTNPTQPKPRYQRGPKAPRAGKRRGQRKPEVTVSSTDSPGSEVSDLPPAFPVHTFHAREIDAATLEELQGVVDAMGLDGR